MEEAPETSVEIQINNPYLLPSDDGHYIFSCEIAKVGDLSDEEMKRMLIEAFKLSENRKKNLKDMDAALNKAMVRLNERIREIQKEWDRLSNLQSPAKTVLDDAKLKEAGKEPEI